MTITKRLEQGGVVLEVTLVTRSLLAHSLLDGSENAKLSAGVVLQRAVEQCGEIARCVAQLRKHRETGGRV